MRAPQGQPPTPIDRQAYAKPRRMTEGELKSIIRRELDMGLGIDGGLLSTHRRQALEYYDGELFGNEIDGRSQVVMRTVLETVEWVLPALLRLFTASDKLVEFEPTAPTPQAEAAAEQATEYVNYIIHRDNPGFMILHDWFKDGLLQKLGWIKVWYDTQQVERTNSYTGLTEQEYAALKQGPNVEIIDERSYPAPMPGITQDAPDPDAAMQHALLYDCTLKVTREEGRVRIEPVPPEEVITSRRARSAKPQDTPFICHKRQRTFTDLLEDGYTPDQLDLVVGYVEPEFNIERVTRYEDEDDFPYQTERTDKPMREIWIEESYLRVDWDGDGKAELRCITTAGGGREILKNETCDDIPLIPICPIPQPHKLVGMSVADLVMDLQFIKSTLIRQMLDNLYLTNNPRVVVGRGAVTDETYDDLLTSRPGGIIRAGDASQIVPQAVPFVAEAAFPMVEYLDQTGEIRSGVSRHNQGLNPDDLNKTATGISLIQQAASQRVELIGRIFAESVRELGRKILGLVARYQQHERVIRVTGQWVPMDPAEWRDEMNVACNVGLGTGNRDQILAHLMQILQVQQGIVAMQQGVQGPLVTAQNVYDVLEKLTENAGFQQSFFTDPSQQPPGQQQQQPPDPRAQAEAQKAQMQAQTEQQRAQAQMAAAHAQAQQQMALKQMQAQADMEIARQKATLQAQLDQQKAEQDMAIERQKALHQMKLERMRTEAKVAAGAMGTA